MNIYIRRDGFNFCGKVGEFKAFWLELAPLIASGLSVKDFCRQKLN